MNNDQIEKQMIKLKNFTQSSDIAKEGYIKMKNGINRQVDLVDIKADVKAGKIVFYVQSGLIYCRDTQNNELVIVGNADSQS